MKTSTIIWVVVLGTLIIGLIFFGLWVRNLKKPTPGRNCHETSDWLWSDDCFSFQEKFFDSSLDSPAGVRPYLINFESSAGMGNPLRLPMWYRFRYVNVSTGGYSDFSEWTTNPVIVGSCCLPCPGGADNCSALGIKTGSSTCNYNKPNIGVNTNDAAYDPKVPLEDGSFVYMNLHRYTGKSPAETNPPADDVKDEIVGYLPMSTTVGGVSYYNWFDFNYNPCAAGCTVPTWCQGSGGSCTAKCDSDENS